MGRQEADLTSQPVDVKDGEDEPPVRRPEVEESVWHAVHASLWGMMGPLHLFSHQPSLRRRSHALLSSGEEHLAEYREDLCLSASSGDLESRLSALQARSMRVSHPSRVPFSPPRSPSSILSKLARQGRHQAALTLLFLPDSIAGMTLTLYQSWAATVWDILSLQARRKSQKNVLDFVEGCKATPANAPGFIGGHPVELLEGESSDDCGAWEKSALEKVEIELAKGVAMKV